MNLLNFIKKNLFIQNIVSKLFSHFPPYLEFTLGKYQAIRKAMYITAHDKTLGSYLEFGVFTGSSFNFAMMINKKIDKIFGNSNCNFFGFDSFKGFGNINEDDKHPAFNDEHFSVNREKVINNIKKNSKGQNYKIIEGFFENTIKGKSPKDIGIDKARVIMIDCDLKNSTSIALEFLKPSLQKGTIILFDDYIFYKGDTNKGEYSAFEDFKVKNSNIKFRSAFEYGYGSKAFIVSDI